MARHSTFTATRENPAGQFTRCPRCESATCRSCTQRRHRAWRLTEQQGLTVEQAAAQMRLPVAHVEQLLAVEQHRRDLKQYVRDTIPTAHARAFVDRHLERHPELTRAAIAEYLDKRQIDLDRQLGYKPYPSGHVQQTIGIPAASQLMIALGHAPNELDGC